MSSSLSGAFRQWSSTRHSLHIITLTTVFILLAFIHVPFNFTILQPTKACNFGTSAYQSFFSMWNLVFFSWIPSIGMLLFGLLTVRHVHQSKMKVLPQNNLQHNQKKLDMQMIRMVIVQSFVFGSASTAYSICQLYISITSNTRQVDSVERVKFNYLSTISNWISLIGPCLSFYLCTCTSKLFRSELMKFFKLERST